MKPLHISSFYFSIGILCVLVLGSCKPEPPTPAVPDPGIFELNFLARVGGQLFEKNTEFENILGQRFSMEVFRLYISDLRLVKEDGTDTLIAETLLMNFAEEEVRKTTHGEGLFQQFLVPSANYKGIKFGIGVPTSRNNSDPTDFASDHPLHASQGMNWNWTVGYKFLQLDGRIDTSANGTGPLDQGIAYHTGTNELYRQLEFTDADHAFEVKAETELQFVIEMDLNRFFYNNSDTINMVQRPISHTNPVGSEAFQLSEKITDNMVNNALYKVPF
ncbi:MAG: MbnP family protein [Bacteroidota bacterium]